MGRLTRWSRISTPVILFSLWLCEQLRNELQSISVKFLPRMRRLALTNSPPLAVLTFGGSTTWGVLLESRDIAYPGLLLSQEPLIGRSDNLAIRASSAVWPSQCLQTMVYEVGAAEVEYDVVILEFSVNGLNGLNLLLQRIRRRYPNALIIYVDLYSNRRPGWSNCISEKCRVTPMKQAALLELVASVGGHLISFPRPADPINFQDIQHYFAADTHHLGEEGHQWVATRVLDLIRVHGRSIVGEKGKWFEGDLCSNWFESGTISSFIYLKGGNMTIFAPGKYAYEIESEAILQIKTEQLRGETPLIFVFMSKGDPSLYPYLQTTLDGNSAPSIVVNPLNTRWADNHVTSTQAVGTISPGSTHSMRLQNLERTKPYPFRLVGVVMCAACQALHVDLAKTCRSAACVQMITDED